MKRRLTNRERVLLTLLCLILLASGYVMLFYMPQNSQQERCAVELEEVRTQTETARRRLDEKHRMEQELKALSSDGAPKEMAGFDNLQPIMTELNTILASTSEFSLNFAAADDTQSIVRRSISMNFTAKDYKTAKAVLQQLHDSRYRCMLENVSLSLGEGASNPVMVNGTIVYFEYQEHPPVSDQKNPPPVQTASS